jgi:predicted RNA-binding protein with PUA-like domain
MNYWLFKSDPDSYGFPDLQKDKKTTWDGVANPVALKNLRNCKKGDKVIVYHTGEGKALVGLAEVIKEAYGDPAVVDIRVLKPLSKQVKLSEVKARKDFSDFALVRLPRLSVMPVTESQWNSLMKMAGEK